MLNDVAGGSGGKKKKESAADGANNCRSGSIMADSAVANLTVFAVVVGDEVSSVLSTKPQSFSDAEFRRANDIPCSYCVR